MRYDGPAEQEVCDGHHYQPDSVDQFVEEEMRLAETMSMAVFLNLNNQEPRQDIRRRKSNLKEVNQLETLDEASRGEWRASDLSSNSEHCRGE